MSEQKTSYTISCSSVFRQAVLDLAGKRRVNAADLARSVMLIVPAAVIEAAEDPGEPDINDRDTVILKSGRSANKPWKRKPRLQVRLPAGLEGVQIRKALHLAVQFDSGTKSLAELLSPTESRETEAANTLAEKEKRSSTPPEGPPEGPPVEPAREPPETPEQDGQDSRATVVPPGPDSAALARQQILMQQHLREAEEEIGRLRATLGILTFEPLAGGVQTWEDALYVFGLPSSAVPDSREVRSRFRMLATIHHPDAPYGDHLRMSQLNAAMQILRNG